MPKPDHKIKVGMVQINNSFSGQNYLPYSVGLIQAFAQKYLDNADNYEFLPPIYKRLPVPDAVKDLFEADIVFFSVYVWNMRISLEIARRIKQRNPETLIVFGGPQVPEKAVEDFLRAHHFIDIACHGEGEEVCLAILKNYGNASFANIPSVSYIDDTKRFIQTPRSKRISDLSKGPSPYLAGVFEPLMREHPEEQWVALWETNRGCPFSCTYCDWGSANKSKLYAFDIERLLREADWFSAHKIEFVFCCDANFGILPRDVEIVSYLSKQKERSGYPKAFSVQNTKNFVDHSYKVSKIMADAGLNKGVSLALQSLNKDTLRYTKRYNISARTFKEAQHKFAGDGIETFTDLILGLPGETYESFAKGVSTVIENGQHNRIQFNNLSVLPNSEMGDPAYQRKYGFDIVETKIINVHGSLPDAQDILETQRLVVGTRAMPKSDWVKARVFGWMAALLHFDKLLQIPFIIINNECGMDFKDLIELFTKADKKYAVLFEILSFFNDKAGDIQRGGVEYCESKEWLNIWWPADEFMLIKMCKEGRLSEFYSEAMEMINDFLGQKKFGHYQDIVKDAILLNKNLIKVPFQAEDMDLRLSCNIWDIYQSVLIGRPAALKRGDYFYRIDRTSIKWSSWQEWCREVVWYGNKKGAYIYNCKAAEPASKRLKDVVLSKSIHVTE